VCETLISALTIVATTVFQSVLRDRNALSNFSNSQNTVETHKMQ